MKRFQSLETLSIRCKNPQSRKCCNKTTFSSKKCFKKSKTKQKAENLGDCETRVTNISKKSGYYSLLGLPKRKR